MAHSNDELITGRLEAIATSAVDAIIEATGDESGEELSALRRFDPRGSHLPASDLYELLRTVEHVYGRQYPALAVRLMELGRVIEATC